MPGCAAQWIQRTDGGESEFSARIDEAIVWCDGGSGKCVDCGGARGFVPAGAALVEEPEALESSTVVWGTRDADAEEVGALVHGERLPG